MTVMVIVASALLTAQAVYQEKECTPTPTVTNGTCTGSAPCTATKVRIEYRDCADCTANPEMQCDNNISPWACEKRQQVTPCIASGGFCIEGAAQPMGDWTQTEEQYCTMSN